LCSRRYEPIVLHIIFILSLQIAYITSSLFFALSFSSSRCKSCARACVRARALRAGRATCRVLSSGSTRGPETSVCRHASVEARGQRHQDAQPREEPAQRFPHMQELGVRACASSTRAAAIHPPTFRRYPSTTASTTVSTPQSTIATTYAATTADATVNLRGTHSLTHKHTHTHTHTHTHNHTHTLTATNCVSSWKTTRCSTQTFTLKRRPHSPS
jgi:hypothetical protein